MKGRVRSQSSENRSLIRLTCLKNCRVLDIITRNDDLFYDLSLVSHLPLRNYKRISSRWLFVHDFVCLYGAL